MDERDSWTCDAMDARGGSFVKALAELARRADPHNLKKIKSAWSEYWAEYEQQGKALQEISEGRV